MIAGWLGRSEALDAVQAMVSTGSTRSGCRSRSTHRRALSSDVMVRRRGRRRRVVAMRDAHRHVAAGVGDEGTRQIGARGRAPRARVAGVVARCAVRAARTAPRAGGAERCSRSGCAVRCRAASAAPTREPPSVSPVVQMPPPTGAANSGRVRDGRDARGDRRRAAASVRRPTARRASDPREEPPQPPARSRRRAREVRRDRPPPAPGEPRRDGRDHE